MGPPRPPVGGWVQNDEAVSSYDGVIDQMTEGHLYLLKHFNASPSVGWQIDPFGNLAVTARLFRQMGFKHQCVALHMGKGTTRSASHSVLPPPMQRH